MAVVKSLTQVKTTSWSIQNAKCKMQKKSLLVHKEAQESLRGCDQLESQIVCFKHKNAGCQYQTFIC